MKQDQLKQFMFVPKIVKYALIFSALVYVIVAGAQYQFQYPSFDVEAFLANQLNLILSLVAVSMIGVASVLKKILSGGVADKDFNIMDNNEKLIFYKKKFIPYIVQLVVYESITIYGLVLSFINKNPSYIIPFAILTIVLMLNTKFEINSTSVSRSYSVE